MDIEEFRRRGKEAVDIIADYYQSVDNHPPVASVNPGYLQKLIPREMPQTPDSYDDIIADMQSKISPGITHWQSGNFFAWFPGCSSYPSIIGEMFSSMYSVIGFNWLCSPAATELEVAVMDWLGKLLGLDNRFLSIDEHGRKNRGGGIIQGSASEALLLAMIAARERKIQEICSQDNISYHEAISKQYLFVAYVSDQTHSCAEKAANILGVQIRIIPSDNNFRLTKDALVAQISQDKRSYHYPFFVCGTFGTTNTTSIDDLPGLADVAEVEHMWLHIDAAYAGAALACPEFRELAQGIERAHSFDFNLNKWMLVNLDCSAMWIFDSKFLTKALSAGRNILYRDSLEKENPAVRNMHNWQIPFSRRFRALKIWFTLRVYGVVGIQTHIRNQVNMAQWLKTQLILDGRFEIVAPVVFGLVVFRLNEKAASAFGSIDLANSCLYQLIQQDGRVFIVSTMVNNRLALRAAIGSVFSTMENVKLLFDVITESATDAISSHIYN
ncbi:hypothetical protein IWW36_003161 [Coemansia brasiliensis]|uniref:Aromatic-L-amino-acid decarboxylase n=1 Tax=Coemansia brasiliensis TaxID=2650707 RepID=A0A9W8I8A5_9FUNG|nr:hypothetical protein IWW36_003161 [Coemansia brasiliensis]